MSQIRAPSMPVVASWVPSGRQARPRTAPECPRSVSSTSPVATSQSLMVRSSLVVTMRRSPRNATALTAAPWPDSDKTSCPVSSSQRLTLESLRAAASSRPSGENARLLEYVCVRFRGTPWWTRFTRPLARFQILTVASSPWEASHLLSGLNAIASTESAWPSSTAIGRPSAESQIRMVWSSPADARDLPSGAKARHLTMAVCPRSVRSSRPVATSQRSTSIGPRSCAVAITRPSGRRARAYTPEQNPVSMSRTCFPLDASQSRTTPHPVVARIRPSLVYPAR